MIRAPLTEFQGLRQQIDQLEQQGWAIVDNDRERPVVEMPPKNNFRCYKAGEYLRWEIILRAPDAKPTADEFAEVMEGLLQTGTSHPDVGTCLLPDWRYVRRGRALLDRHRQAKEDRP